MFHPRPDPDPRCQADRAGPAADPPQQHLLREQPLQGRAQAEARAARLQPPQPRAGVLPGIQQDSRHRPPVP